MTYSRSIKIATKFFKFLLLFQTVFIGYRIYKYDSILTTWTVFYEFLLMPLLVGLAYVFILSVKPTWRPNLMLILVSSLMALYTAEGILMFTNPQDIYTAHLDEGIKSLMSAQKVTKQKQALAKKQNIPFSARNPIQVFWEEREKEPNTYVAVAPYIIFSENLHQEDFFPLSGISNANAVWMINEIGVIPTYQSDSLGFKNASPFPCNPRCDVVAIGDSFTQSASVPTETGLVETIRKAIPSTLNLGLGGSGPLVEYAQFREFAKPFKPKYLLWFFYENDLGDIRREKQSAMVQKYVEDSTFTQNLINRQAETDQFWKSWHRSRLSISQYVKDFDFSTLNLWLVKLKGFLWLWQVNAQLDKLTYFFQPPISAPVSIDEINPSVPEDVETTSFEFAEELKVFKQILGKVRQETKEMGSEMLFVYLPDYNLFQEKENPFHYTNSIQTREAVLQTIASLQIPSLDLTPTFEASGDPLQFFPLRLIGHYNEAGYKLVAETTLEKLSTAYGFPEK